MNDLLEQFLIECRELVEAATVDLLALETSPRDQERVDGAFRAFHTLKGAAGIVGFTVMGQVLHAAESLLDSIRVGNRPVSARLIDDCLACLDQVVRWLDDIEARGDIPELPDHAGDALAARLTPPPSTAHQFTPPQSTPSETTPPEPALPKLALSEPAPSEPAPSEPAPSEPAPPGVAEPAPARASVSDAPDWLTTLLARHAAHRAQARSALRYAPDADCFFRGEDPLALVAALPGILALDMVPAKPWPVLAELNLYACNLVITALLTGSPHSVATLLQPATGEVEICPVVATPAAAPLSPAALAVLQEQLRMAANHDPAGFAGRLGSAGRAALNVFNRAGLAQASGALSDAIAQSQREGHGATFIAALRALLAQLTPQPAAASTAKATPAIAAEETRPAPDAAPNRAADPAPRTQVVRALRVDADRIDALVNLTGEITVVKNAIGYTARLARDGAKPDDLLRRLKDQHALLDRLVAELQRSVLGIRVLPLQHVFQHFPRLVREIAQDLNKSVQLVIEGQTTEADKATVEALFEPLLHVLRNALSHGVEPPEDRLAAGKSARATVQLRATRDGDQVIVEVTDDGRGIDVANIRRRAARLGLASEAVLADMTDQAVTELIFSPGFSTAASVTAVSGRGVGMDAVRAAVTRLGGRVTVTSEPGIGTSVRITLPFTVMMLRVMTVEAGGQSFGIPIETVVETAKVPRDRIVRLGAAEAIVLRDRTVPLIRLNEVLGLFSADSDPDPHPHPDPGPAADADARIVVVSVSGQNATDDDEAEQIGALEVDAQGERVDVMLKPMEGLLAGAKGFAGTTVLGDGRVLLVLDLAELLR